ncbi:uncharacterized protein METZ01_LOCUS157864 [marine metagenome]|uniref:Uncharacterized protein n=1 Tax=marine metagenome TaxID=408172 RepID=A0A382ATZ2_9ZZZZ
MEDFGKPFYYSSIPCYRVYGHVWWVPGYQRNGTADIDSA